MTTTSETVPEALAEIIDEFKMADDREKLELLLEYSDTLPALPERLERLIDEMEQVEECQSPVAIHAESDNGRIQFFFAIPESAPTVRGFAGIMLEGTLGATPEEILQIPADFFVEMGLTRVLSPQRLNGIGAILAHMKRMAVSHIEGPSS
ncbi:SufE family protein [soil metagenome]